MTHLFVFFGMGLISGSMAIDLRRQYAQKANQLTIVGLDLSAKSLKFAQENKIIDVGFEIQRDDMSAAYSLLQKEYLTIENIEKQGIQRIVAVIATPVGAFEGVFKNLAALNLDPKVIEYLTITDVGSTKSIIVEKAKQHLGNLKGCFVPAHPIAGREQSGVDAAIENLYKDKWCFLIFDSQPNNSKLSMIDSAYQQRSKIVNEMWETIGAKIVQSTAEDHDKLFAELSHAPHFLAFAAAHVFQKIHYKDAKDTEKLPTNPILAKFLRIAHADPTMWADIARDNSENILQVIENFKKHINNINNIINNKGNLEKFLSLDKLENSHVYHAKIGVCGSASSTTSKKISKPNQNLDKNSDELFVPLILPLMIAHFYLQSITQDIASQENLKYAGSGLRDFTSPVEVGQNIATLKQIYEFLEQPKMQALLINQLNAFKAEIATIESYIKDHDDHRNDLLKYIERLS